MNISKIRSILYKTAKYLGDFDSIGKKRVGQEELSLDGLIKDDWKF